MAGTLSTGGSLSSCAYYVSFWILAQISSGTPHEIGIVGRPFRKSYLPHVIRGSFYRKSGFYLSEWISSGMKEEGGKKEKNFLPAALEKDAIYFVGRRTRRVSRVYPSHPSFRVIDP